MRIRFGGFCAALAAAALATCSPARATVHLYDFIMDGPSEFPVNASPGTGTGSAAYDDVAQTLTMSASFSGLIGTVTQTHFHGPTGVSGLAPGPNPTDAQRQAAATAAMNASIMVGNTSLPGFPLTVQSGVYNQVIDLTQGTVYNQTFLNTTHGGNVANARAAFVGGLASGQVYWNIHTGGPGGFGGGEIRGFSRLVPEPATAGLAALALAALTAARRRRR